MMVTTTLQFGAIAKYCLILDNTNALDFHCEEFGIIVIYHLSAFNSLHFGSIVWGSAKPKFIQKLKTQQKKAIRHIVHRAYNSHTAKLFQELEYFKVNDLISLKQAIFDRNYEEEMERE